MAVNTTEILGTDSLSGSRLVINDNFNALKDEINSIENYIDPSSGIIDSLASLETESLRVGVSSPLLEINSTTFDIVSDVTITGDLTLVGELLITNIETTSITDTSTAPSLIQEIGSATAVPPKSVYRMHNTGTSAVTVQLFNGAIGQEILFIYEGGGSGAIDIVPGTNATFTLTGSSTTITLTEAGQTVKLFCTVNSTGTNEWYIVGGNGYTLS
jgi:hypothetical protein